MARVFISYAREDRHLAQEFAKMMAEADLDVWWDIDLIAGDNYFQEIETQISLADKVVVIWTAASRASDFVQDEARRAKDLGKLVPILMHRVQPPIGFGSIQAVNWIDASASKDDILRALGRPTSRASYQTGPKRNFPRGRRSIATRLLLGILLIALPIGTAGMQWLDRHRLDPIKNCWYYRCDLNYVTYKAERLGLQFVYPMAKLTLDSTQTEDKRLPFLSNSGKQELLIHWRDRLESDDIARDRQNEVADLTAAAEAPHYIAPEASRPITTWYVVSGFRKDGRIYYIRRFYRPNSILSFDFEYPMEKKALYDDVIVDMTIRSLNMW